MKLRTGIFRTFLLLIFVSVFSSCSSKTSNAPQARLATVHVPLTNIENQAGAGFCWSYTLHAYVESLAKQRGLEINLSEEYAGLHHILADLEDMLKTSDPASGLSNISDGYMYEGALNLFAQVGMIPEDVFNVKFTESPGDIAKRFFASEFNDAEKLASYRANPNKLREKLGELVGRVIPNPDTAFAYNGIMYTPKTFMNKKLNFIPADYAVRQVESAKINQFNLDTAIIKSVLLSKIPVPLAVGVFPGVDNQWNSEACEKGYCYTVGGHAMLAVDFVTENGRGGQMPESEIKRVFRNKLEHLVVKNSWGKRGLTQEGEFSSDESLLGFDVLTRDFMRYSAVVFTTQYVVPKKFVEAKQYLVGYDFVTDIALEKIYNEGEQIKINGVVLDSVTKSDKDIAFSWAVFNRAGATVFNGKGSEIQIPALPQGEYEVVLNAVLGSESNVTTKTLSVLKTYDVFKDKIPVKISNNISWDIQGPETIISLNYKNEDAVHKSAPMIIEFSEFTLQAGRSWEFSFVQKSTDPFVSSPLIQIAFNGDDKFIALPCEETIDRGSKTTSCSLPTFEPGLDVSKAKVRFYSDLNRASATKVNDNQLVYDFKVKSSQALAIQRLSLPVNASFPTGTSELQQQMVGNAINLQGLFSSNIDSARIYVDGKFFDENSVSNLRVTDTGFLLATKAFVFNEIGYHEIKFVAIKEAQELSFITYKVLVAPKLSVAADKETVLVGGNKLNAAIDPVFVPFALSNGDIRLIFSEISSEGLPYLIDDNVTGRIVTWLDLSAVENPGLFFAAGLNLEKDFDYLKIYASDDAGASFTLLHAFTGGENILTAEPLPISLLPYAKKDNVLLMIELETDQGVRSETGFIRKISINNQP